MVKIETSIVVDASIERVWDCLTDCKHYPAWNQFIRKIEGDFVENQQVKIELHFPDQKIMTIKPICTKVEKNKELRWVGTFLWSGLFRGEHYFKLEKLSDTTTKLIHAENFSGILSNYFKKTRAPITEKAFHLMNENLVAKVSRGNSGPSKFLV